jgi:hypothetical protein
VKKLVLGFGWHRVVIWDVIGETVNTVFTCYLSCCWRSVLAQSPTPEIRCMLLGTHVSSAAWIKL